MMLLKRACYASVLSLSIGATGASAAEFSFTFEWGDIPLCTDGFPNRVSNPIFKLTGVPAGTQSIDFNMTDLDVPSYDHGGGNAGYSGNDVIGPGAFKYNSPCPPDGAHTYEWSAEAKDASGKTLASAKARTKYPE
jgi:phosphatidylethanolamine-binding protein (PEBP) family uncharacterized protein